jgi:aspartokinase-like uncharacterized kinase
VIKLGGSLLDWPEMPAAWAGWLAAQPPADNVVIAGGGRIVEALRELDRVGSLGEEAAHWLAIEGMSLTAALTVELLAGATLARDLDELPPNDDTVTILDVARFMRADAESADPLPCSWTVTSDSIAARLAHRIAAEELVLLKSALAAVGLSREHLACSNYVDAYFPLAAKGLIVRAVNLRGEGWPETTV